MIVKVKNLIIFLFFSFAVYCALVVGQSWDEFYHTDLGKRNLVYLLTLGRVESYLGYSQYYSSFYWSLQYFFSQLFSIKYQTEINHLINLLFSFSTLFALNKIGKQLFNKEIGKIFFFLLFFYPSFFGNMGMNPKDIILAFCHVWIFYLALRYLSNQKRKRKIYTYYISCLIAMGTGIQLYFPATLLIIIIFLIIEIFFFRKLICKDFEKGKFYKDLIKIFFLSFAIFVFFAPDTHGNILHNIYTYYLESFKTSRGPTYMLNNGIIYSVQNNYSVLYFYKFFLYKSPEFIIILYILFLIFFLKIKENYQKNISNYAYKLTSIIILILFPLLILIFSKFKPYDELRLFLWIIPYFMIIPGLTIHFVYKNLNFLHCRILFFFLLILILIYLTKFFSYTPYQYTYFNVLLEKNINDKFEIDYQGISLKELVKKNQSFFKVKNIKLSTCGLSPEVLTKYLKYYTQMDIKFVQPHEAEYIVIVNRAITNQSTCLQLYKGENIAEIKRDNKSLSLIKKIKNEQ